MKFLMSLLTVTVSLYTFACPSESVNREYFFLAYNEGGARIEITLPEDMSLPGSLQISTDKNPERTEVLLKASIANTAHQGNPDQEVRSEGDGVSLDLGRSGHLELRFNKDGSCQITSTLAKLYLPKATRFDNCHYDFYSPRPGLSGSN